MNFRRATREYEAWLASHIRLLPADLRLKHQRMREDVFSFMRATYYRWAAIFPELCPDLQSAPRVLAVGDLHVENFGTWRDAEGRLVWGINDFDEAAWLPSTNDLVRLSTSVILAVQLSHLSLKVPAGLKAVLQGYLDSLDAGGRPFVLAHDHHALRTMAFERLREPSEFWGKLDPLRTIRGRPSRRAYKALVRQLPKQDLPHRLVHRIAGLGSLGRQRFVALAEWEGGKIARETKALAPSAAAWAAGHRSPAIHYQEILQTAIRCRDPFVSIKRGWVTRRLSPDCSRIELSDLPRQRDELRLLHAMGWETANVHLGSGRRKALRAAVTRRKKDWLVRAARVMADAVEKDWKEWSGRR